MNTAFEALRELREDETGLVGGGEHRPSDPPLLFPEWPDELFGSAGDL